MIFYANHKFLAKEDLTNIGLSNQFVGILLLIIFGILLIAPHINKKSDDTRLQQQLLEEAEIAGRKYRFETKCLQTRIVDMMKKTFETVKIVENVAFKCGDIECIIPLIGITPKGVLLFQFIDHPGKALFGKMNATTWNLAQSDKCTQEIPNAMFTAFELAMAVKQETDLDVKPIAVISKYTMAEPAICRNSFRFNIVKEVDVLHELDYMRQYGANKQLTDDFMEEVKNRFEQLDLRSRS